MTGFVIWNRIVHAKHTDGSILQLRDVSVRKRGVCEGGGTVTCFVICVPGAIAEKKACE